MRPISSAPFYLSLMRQGQLKGGRFADINDIQAFSGGFMCPFFTPYRRIPYDGFGISYVGSLTMLSFMTQKFRFVYFIAVASLSLFAYASAPSFAQGLDIPDDGTAAPEMAQDIQLDTQNTMAGEGDVNIQLLEVDEAPMVDDMSAPQDDVTAQPLMPAENPSPELLNMPGDAQNDTASGDVTNMGAPESGVMTLTEGNAVPPVFYDASDIVPSEYAEDDYSVDAVDAAQMSDMASPKTSPASKFIIIQKDAEEGSQSTQIIAASRAAKLGRYESALRIYDGLYSKNPRDGRILIGRANVLQKLGRIDEAIKSYQELLDINPENIEARVNMLGLMTEKYPAVALRNLMILHKEHSGHVGIVAQIGLAQARLGAFDEALEYFGMASAMEPRNANHLFNMAVIADRAGKNDDAISYYEQALELDTIHGAGQTIPRDAIFERLADLR